MTDKQLKDIICLHDPKKDLVYMVKVDHNIDLFTYHFDFKRVR